MRRKAVYKQELVGACGNYTLTVLLSNRSLKQVGACPWLYVTKRTLFKECLDIRNVRT